MDPYAAAPTYPPPPSAQIQPPTQDPYLYNQPQPYPYYPPQIPQQQYPNPNPVYQPHPEQEPAPIHPPGVPVQNDPNHIAAYQQGYAQPHFQNDPYYQQQQQPQPQPQPQQLSYPDAGMVHQGQHQWQPQGQTGEFGLTALYPPNGQGQFSGSGRGTGRGGFRGGGQGRGRGKGRSGKITTEPKPRAMAWCELCRVDCNTLEILENHRNGKKHKKNLKIQEDLQKLAAKTQESQIPPAPESEQQQNQNGLKRKTREVERKPVEAVKKQKEIVPFICELCDVKCESGPTFDSHLKGKKHVFNLQRFQEQQATLGQAALQALYPALEALYPALLQTVTQNTNASTSTPLDHQLLQWLQSYLAQTGSAILPQGPGPVPVPGPGFGPLGPTQEGPVPVPGPGFVVPGPTQEGPKEVTGTQVEPVKETEIKIEEKVGPESGARQVELNRAEPEQEQEPKPEEEAKVEAKAEEAKQ